MQQTQLHFSQAENDYRIKEAYKTLRSNVEFSGSDVRAISVTSCSPGEGKSSVSMALARAFAEAGKKTVLVDADMRKSVLVGRYRTGTVRLGLTHCLVGREKLSSVICETDIPNLYVIFSGPVPPNPSELLGGKMFSKMLDNMRHVFDYIIIDTPPLGSVIDAAVIAKQCDGTVLVIQDNAVSYRFAQRVKDQLDKAGAKMLGVVLNKVDLSGKGIYSHYGKYYGRYYGKYYGKYYGNYGEEVSKTSIAAVGTPPRRTETPVHHGAPDRDLDDLDYIEGVVRKD
ncbi:MAG: polysaccharide biosynthesis tyrosine autokinase [Butyrivibrio sp.]|nr:polysaccharide biosynthesis tyrosine autokinase [Butyrivibrio sp.]